VISSLVEYFHVAVIAVVVVVADHRFVTGLGTALRIVRLGFVVPTVALGLVVKQGRAKTWFTDPKGARGPLMPE
jgi:hypothetical protein